MRYDFAKINQLTQNQIIDELDPNNVSYIFDIQPPYTIMGFQYIRRARSVKSIYIYV